MAGLLDFAARFGTEERCIEHLAGLRWPGGFVCSGCSGRLAWRLKARPRGYECGTCHRQEAGTAGENVFLARGGLMKGVFCPPFVVRRPLRAFAEFFYLGQVA